MSQNRHIIHSTGYIGNVRLESFRDRELSEKYIAHSVTTCLTIVDGEQAKRKRQTVMDWNSFCANLSQEELVQLRDRINGILEWNAQF